MNTARGKAGNGSAGNVSTVMKEDLPDVPRDELPEKQVEKEAEKEAPLVT